MNGDKFVESREEAVDCVTSLHAAMQDAGGVVLSYEKMKSMTLMDFITTMAAQNNIRFYYRKSKE